MPISIRDVEVAGSNPVTQTIDYSHKFSANLYGLPAYFSPGVPWGVNYK